MRSRVIAPEPVGASRGRSAGDPVRRQRTPSTDPPAALILTFASHFDAYDIVRSLGKDGIDSNVATTDVVNLASFSKYCRQVFRVPANTPEKEKEILNTLIEIARELGGTPALFYASDPELFFVQKYRTELSRHYKFLLPPTALMDSLFSKVEFSKFAEANGLPVPVALIVEHPGDLEKVRDRITFPCIVKPAFQHDWYWQSEEEMKFFGWYKHALRRFGTMEELDEFIRRLPYRKAGYLIQSYVDGGDDSISSFHGYFDEQSNCLGWFLGRKIRTNPPGTGGSSYIRTIIDDDLARASIAHLKRIRFTGIVKIDYKWDPVHRKHQMLEINPRYNLWEVLGAYAGINLSAVAYRHQCGELRHGQDGKTPAAPVSAHYEDDRRYIFFKGDLLGYLTGYRKTKEWSFGAYLGSLLRPIVYRVFDPVDPLPFLWSSLHFAGQSFGKVVRRVLSGRPILSGGPTGPAVPVGATGTARSDGASSTSGSNGPAGPLSTTDRSTPV